MRAGGRFGFECGIFGSIERSYTRAADGTWYFNLEEPLTRFKIVRGLRQGGTA